MASNDNLTRAERRILREHYGARAIWVNANDEVSILTDEQRGDGGPVPWWKFVGWIEDARRDLERL